MKNLKEYEKCFILFFIGGALYIGIEYMFRGFSDLSMFLAGGICFVLIGLLNEGLPWNFSLVSQMFLSALIITAVEFFFGMVLNVWLEKGIWDYSNMPFNYKGQICLLFSNYWFFLSLPAILLDDWLRCHLLGEEKPKYKIF